MRSVGRGESWKIISVPGLTLLDKWKHTSIWKHTPPLYTFLQELFVCLISPPLPLKGELGGGGVKQTKKASNQLCWLTTQEGWGQVRGLWDERMKGGLNRQNRRDTLILLIIKTGTFKWFSRKHTHLILLPIINFIILPSPTLSNKLLSTL